MSHKYQPLCMSKAKQSYNSWVPVVDNITIELVKIQYEGDTNLTSPNYINKNIPNKLLRNKIFRDAQYFMK